MVAIKGIPFSRGRISRYREFQRRQRENLRASQHSTSPLEEVLGPDALGPRDPSTPQPPAPGEAGDEASAGSTPEGEVTPGPSHEPGQFGRAGRPLNRFSPFYLGFVGATGAIFAYALWHVFGRLSTTLTIVIVALFLALALDPLVRWLCARGMKRGAAVGVVFAGVLVVFGLLSVLVVPPVISEGTDLLDNAPEYVDAALNSKIVQRLDRSYDVVDKIQTEVNSRLTDSGFISRVFGGVLGAGKVLANGVFQAFTVLILTLYFLASLPKMKRAGYAMVPASRRPRVEPLAEEIMRRTGAYAIGQVTVATINAVLSYVMMRLVGIPYAAVLSVVVGFLGLIPMVGATIGAILVVGVALFDSTTSAVIAGIYYLLYQQLENYVVAPKVMARTVSVPGAITVVAALAGGTLLGVLGALLAVPVAAGLLLLYEQVLVPRQRRA